MFWPLLVLLVVIFGGMVWLLRYILSRHYLTATTRLEGLSAEYLRRQDELKKRLEESERQHKEHVAQAKAEAEQLLAQAKKEAEAARTRLVDQARTESERIVQQAMGSREVMRKEIEQGLNQRISERASALVHAVLSGGGREALQSHWLEELLRNGLSQFKGAPLPEDLREAKVVCAAPLTPAQRETLRKRLKEQVGRELTLKEETDERLIAGLVITLGSLVLDGSLASRLQQALRHAQDTP